MPAIKVKLTEEELAALDSAAGEVPRERFIRRVLADAVASSGVAITGAVRAANPSRDLALPGALPRGAASALAEAPDETPLPPKVPPRGGWR